MPVESNRFLRVNVGCGATPTRGWMNFDNSLTVRLARVPLIVEVLAGLQLVGDHQLKFARIVRREGIRWADATRRLPLPDACAGVVYSSHMLEHLDPASEVPRFLSEVLRILVPNGILRLAVPDLRQRAERYLATGDADEFVASLRMAGGTPRGLLAVARHLVAGYRNHRWMYDAQSLIRLLKLHGFRDPRALPAGETAIPEPGPLNLREREEESVYVEGYRP